MNPVYDSDPVNGSDLLVEPDDYMDDTEKDEVAIIEPDQLDVETESPAPPLADNFEAMKVIALPPLLEQPPILEDKVYTWQIEGWRTLPKKHHGPIFEAGGFPWRILMFPYGNNSDAASFYLEHGFEEGQIPEDWSCCVQFSLILWNPNDPSMYITHTAHHRFTKEEGDWGFTRFMDTRKLFSPSYNNTGRPMVENDKANMTAYVRIVKDETGVLWHNFTNYDSKKETGYVGLKNQGATCYLNSLIQSLYLTNAFRKAVYQIPTENEETLQNSAYTLQRLFYQLQTSSTAVGTNELTKSFGWETRHIFEQQDVQELSRKLMERMEERMKGTEAENVLPRLFCGKVRTYISCINVEYESRRVEDFWDIQLNVAGNKNIEDSFRDYIQVETMDGENQYFAGDEFKLQDAKKGVIFESFPEVLHLQLKRFQYDIDRDAMMKINDRYEFPETFDAAPYLSEDADKSEPWIYQLHGVLVHSGDLNAGHYYAFIKPSKDGWFYKYDDDKVTKATIREVLEDNFGGEVMPTTTNPLAKVAPVIRQNSAYMLVYIRQTRVDGVLPPVSEEDTPPHLQRKLDEEAAIREAKRKERDEQHLYLNARVITDDTFKAYHGLDLTDFTTSHEVDPSAARSYRLLRTSTLKDLLDTVRHETATDPRSLRFWSMVGRQNKTTRPDQPLADVDMTIEEAYQRYNGKELNLRLWAEKAEEIDENGVAIWPVPANSQNPQNLHNGVSSKPDLIVLFLKWFNIEKQEIIGIGYLYISRDKKVEDLVPLIRQRMDWPELLPNGEKTQLKLFEEIKPDMIDMMKAKQSLRAAELQDGDIVCFQLAVDVKSPDLSKLPETDSKSISQLPIRPMTDSKSSSNGGALKSPTSMRSNNSIPQSFDHIDDARVFYDFLRHKRVIQVRPHPSRGLNPPEPYEPFVVTMSAKHNYDQVVAKIGGMINIAPTHLRLWTVNATTDNPKQPVRRGQAQTLNGLLNPPYGSFNNNNQKNDSLYFEVLDMSLQELDTKKAIRVIWLSEGITKEEIFDLLVPKQGTVEDLIACLVKKGQLEDEATAGEIRVYEVHSSKIHRELPRNHTVANITDYIQVVCERTPEEDATASDQDFIQVFHFHGESNKSHGIPFKFLIKPREKFSETKKRLEKRTGIKGKNFEKIKFAVVRRMNYGKPIYLTDDDVLWEVASSNDDMLGLDHVDRSRVVRNGAGDLFLK